MEQKELKGGSYKESRELFVKQGPWILPTGIPKSKFCEIAYLVMLKLKLADRENLFDNPNYWTRCLVNKMQLSMIYHNIHEGLYEGWTDPVLPFFEDILKLFDYYSLYVGKTGSNLHNSFEDGNKVMAEFARIFALMPEYFGKACFSMDWPQLATSEKKQKNK